MDLFYFIDKNNVRQGPVPENELVNYSITPETMVWCNGMTNWVAAKNVSKLRYLFDSYGVENQSGYQPPEYNQYQQPGTQASGYNQYQQPYGFQPGMQPQYKPNSNLVWAILTTLFCCLPFGIVSIVYASKVDSMWHIGNYAGAQDASKKAGTWAMWAAIVGGIIIVAYIILIAIFGIGYSYHMSKFY